MIELLKLYRRIYSFFGNHEKARLWFTTKNEMFGGWPPIYFFRLNRANKVKQFVDDSLEIPPEYDKIFQDNWRDILA